MRYCNDLGSGKVWWENHRVTLTDVNHEPQHDLKGETENFIFNNLKRCFIKKMKVLSSFIDKCHSSDIYSSQRCFERWLIIVSVRSNVILQCFDKMKRVIHHIFFLCVWGGWVVHLEDAVGHYLNYTEILCFSLLLLIYVVYVIYALFSHFLWDKKPELQQTQNAEKQSCIPEFAS